MQHIDLGSRIEGIAGLPDQELAVVKYILKNKKRTSAQIVSLLDVKDRRARGILKNLVEKEIIATSGKARNTVYIAGVKFPDKL